VVGVVIEHLAQRLPGSTDIDSTVFPGRAGAADGTGLGPSGGDPVSPMMTAASRRHADGWQVNHILSCKCLQAVTETT
jgi:hypothetical protein